MQTLGKVHRERALKRNISISGKGVDLVSTEGKINRRGSRSSLGFRTDFS